MPEINIENVANNFRLHTCYILKLKSTEFIHFPKHDKGEAINVVNLVLL